jgi:hypothetical protein
MKFSIRNNDGEPLPNDTRTTISLPAGTISAEGLAAIQRYLYDSNPDGMYRLSYGLDPLGDQWQTKAGNYAKRLSGLAYKTYGVKLTPEIMSRVGCIARDHSKQADVAIEVTRELNQGAAAFGNPGSCWWSGYGYSRCALKTNGGFGLRTFGNFGRVHGRAWVMPLRQRNESDRRRGQGVPTFDTRTPDAFVVFNGYGDLGGYTAPRILAHMAGWTYRKIRFEASPMYVNSLSGYLVTREEIAERHAGELELYVSQHASLYEDERAEKEKAAARAEAA